MALIRAQVSFAHTSGLPEDILSNTFHFTTADILAPTLDAVATAVEEFYEAGATPLYTFFSNEMAQNGHVIRLYNLDEPAPRVPLLERAFSLPVAPNGDPLPGEVALVVSFQGTPVSGLNQARRRGRVYVGRLDKDSASAGRPSAALIASAVAAADDLLADSVAAAMWSWAVYSPTDDAAGDPTPFTIVEEGWVDNAFDTQRRRGLAPTARTTFI